MLVSSDDRLLNSTTLLLNNIAQFSHEFYLKPSNKHNGLMRMFVLADVGMNAHYDSFLTTIPHTFNTAIAQLDSNKSKAHAARMYEQRNKINSLLQYKNNLFPGFSTIVVLFFVNYYVAVIDGNL